MNEPGWREALGEELGQPTLQQLLHAEQSAGAVVYPPRELIFAAFERTPLDQARVVIVGQDPYHGPGQATGLAFSVPRDVPVPPSLRNVFTELGTDLGVERPAHGDLSSWADQGVLLLNTSLTVRAGEAGSHAGRGWERLTNAALTALATERDELVFLLWGRHAQIRAEFIDADRHLVLQAAHPSPLSAARGFFGCRHFSQANAYLQACGASAIDWSLPQ